MKLNQLLSFSETNYQQFISGSKEAEISYLKFHFKRFKILHSMVKSMPLGKLLDIGTTPFTFFLKKHSNQEVFAFDYNNYLKDRSESLNIHFQSGDIVEEELPYEKSFFDTVIFAEVFEHIHSDPIKLLKRIKKTIKPGGILIFGTPNMASFANRLKLFLNQPILDYPTWDDEVHGHDRIYVKKELVEYFTKAGFKIKKISFSSCVDFIPRNDDSKPKRVVKYLTRVFSYPFRAVFPSLNGTIFIIAQKSGEDDI